MSSVFACGMFRKAFQSNELTEKRLCRSSGEEFGLKPWRGFWRPATALLCGAVGCRRIEAHARRPFALGRISVRRNDRNAAQNRPGKRGRFLASAFSAYAMLDADQRPDYNQNIEADSALYRPLSNNAPILYVRPAFRDAHAFYGRPAFCMRNFRKRSSL